MNFNSEDLKKKFEEVSDKVEKTIKEDEMKHYRSQLNASKFIIKCDENPSALAEGMKSHK